MRFNIFQKEVSLPLRITLLSLLWIILISWLHYQLNIYEGHRKVVQMGYMPVVTNMAAPLLDQASLEGDGLRFKALKFSSFAEMADALRNDQIQAAFIIAPLSIVLKQQGEEVRVVYIGNRHESTMVTRKDLKVNRLADLAGKTIAVPMRYSGHNLGLRRKLAAEGLLNSVSIVEMNPPDMASAMITGSLDAYFVGEPFAAQTLQSGDASLLFHVEDIWENFICNLLITKQSLIENDPEMVKALVQGAARSGIWARNNVDEAANIAARYWNQPVDLIKYAMTTPADRILVDRYTPVMAEMQEIADLMVKFDLAENNEISGLVEDSFAKEADTSDVTTLESILAQPDK